MKKILFLLLAVVSCFAYGQNITQAEYFYDLDPGFGQGQAIEITASSTIEVDEMLNINTLDLGFHVLHLRVKDANNEWSSVLSHPFFIDVNQGITYNINILEYFFDDDPGFGEGQGISISAASDVEINDMLNTSELSSGFHVLHMRAKNSMNEWSSVLSTPFYIEKNQSTASEIVYLEYFFDEDPGYNNGIPYANLNQGAIISELFFANMSGLDQGTHTIFLRMKNELELWSQTLSQTFELMNCDLSISGNIIDQNNEAITSGLVVLYQSFGEGSAMGVDTVYLSNGNYQFTTVCPNSQYFIKVLPENNDDFLATYYGNTPYWQQASIISTIQSSIEGINIQTQDFAEMDIGTSRVGGHIYHAEYKGEPVQNIDVVLEFDDDTEKSDFLAVAYDRSDEYGAWEIDKLPTGSYRIKVEIPGLEMDTTYYISITTENTFIDNLNYYVDFNTGIFIEHFGIEELGSNQNLCIYPNPSINNIWVEVLNPNVIVEDITIYLYSGQKVKFKPHINQSKRINIDGLSKGFYLIKIQTNKGLSVEKVIIQ